MKSARINFGIPESEYIVQVDDTGAAISCYNQDTETEYIGGGGGSNTPFITHLDENDLFTNTWNEIKTELEKGRPCYVSAINNTISKLCPIIGVGIESNRYVVYICNINSFGTASCSSPDDYPDWG